MIETVHSGLVSGFVHRPDDVEAKDALVLAHGASSDSRSKLIVAVATAFSEAGFAVLRVDLPFRQRRGTGPPNPSTAMLDREGLREACAFMRPFGRVLLGGHSYGGRQASMLAADEPDVCSGLLLFSYPLHPPGKPDRKRVDHFPRLRSPAVFVHGTRDPFGSPEEMREALAMIASAVSLHLVERAGHDLKPLLGGAADVVSLATSSLL